MTFMSQLLLGVYANAVISFPLWLLHASNQPERAVVQWEEAHGRSVCAVKKAGRDGVCGHVNSHTRSGLSRDFSYSSRT